MQRSHPLVAVLAETLLERTLSRGGDDSSSDPGTLGRVGCWVSGVVSERTVIALLRVRDVARALGMTVRTIYTAKSRVLDRLRKVIRQRQGDDR